MGTNDNQAGNQTDQLPNHQEISSQVVVTIEGVALTGDDLIGRQPDPSAR
jgi:hypothetical protein